MMVLLMAEFEEAAVDRCLFSCFVAFVAYRRKSKLKSGPFLDRSVHVEGSLRKWVLTAAFLGR
jgi:hypothetical protein